jgi:pantoate--beta-alanine ligase
MPQSKSQLGMQQVESVATLRETIRRWRQAGETIAFVPTMGNLHAGHLALVARAKALAAHTVVSIFVNPLQFGPAEDFARYPRTLQADQVLLQPYGIDLLFTPSVETIYPRPQAQITRIQVPGLNDILCGAFRPGHFDGVATVVAKLFNLVQPDSAVFGKKDYQQWRVIQRMVQDLNIPVQIIGVDTVREADGLAMSSRNQYLDAAQRRSAVGLYSCLQDIRGRILAGAGDYSALRAAGLQTLRGLGFDPEYVEIRNSANLAAAGPGDRELVVLAAARLGATRLIDNLEILRQ